MNNTELDLEFRSMAADPPDPGAVRAAVIRGIDVRSRRRRATALTSSAVAVVLLISGIGVASRLGQGAPGPAGPTWPVERPVNIPAGSHMVPFTGSLTVTAPVTPTVDAPAATDTVLWTRDVNTLQVGWTNPHAAGVSTAVAPSGSTAKPADVMQRGYVISPAAGLTVWGRAADGTEKDRLAPLVAPRQILLAGHPATLGGDPGSAWASLTFGLRPVTRWVEWKLPDGRYIHAWAGTGGDAALLAFAGGLVNQPTSLTRRTTVGATLPGYTVEGISELGTSTELDGASSVLCPAGTTSTQGQVTRPCLTVNVYPTWTMRPDPTATITSITVDGVTTRMNKATHEATADLGNGFYATLFNAMTTDIPDLDIATLAASVRLNPAVAAGHSPLLDPPTGDASTSSPGSPGGQVTVTITPAVAATSTSTATPTTKSGR